MAIMTKDINQKPGYKQTEVGAIPEDWEVKKLSMITQFINGKAHEQFIDDKGDFIVINSKFVSTEGKVIKYSKENLSPLFIGDVVMVMSDIPNGKALAKCFFVRENGKYTLNQRICSLRSYDSDSRYLFYKLNRNQYFLSFDSGVGQTNLKKSEVLDCPVALPPSKSEQRAIAAALSDVDALITSLDRLIAKKRDIKQATMQQLLTGKIRLPGFSGELMPGGKQTEVGEIPEDWDVKKLGEIGECLIGLTYRPSDVKSDGLLVLRASNIADNRLVFTDNVFVNVEVPDKLILRKDDILICVRNGSRNLIGKCVLIDDRAKGVTFGAFMSIFRTKYAHFVFYQFQSKLIQRQIHENIGATINQITNKNLNSFQIPLPSLPEQQAIADILSDMDAEIISLEQKRDKTHALKQGMMQELLTGKTRLL